MTFISSWSFAWWYKAISYATAFRSIPDNWDKKEEVNYQLYACIWAWAGCTIENNANINKCDESTQPKYMSRYIHINHQELTRPWLRRMSQEKNQTRSDHAMSRWHFILSIRIPRSRPHVSRGSDSVLKAYVHRCGSQRGNNAPSDVAGYCPLLP